MEQILQKKKWDIEAILLIVLVIVVIISIGFMAYTLIFQGSYSTTSQSYQRALGAENPDDICATPEGYSDEQWREHMSHHPDRYIGCL